MNQATLGSDRNESGTTSVFEGLLMRAYDGRTPPEQLAYLRSLTADRAELVIRRLDAIIRTLAGEISIDDGARAAGLGRSAFHAARRRWREGRTLRALTPYSTVAYRYSTAKGGSRAATSVVDEIVAEAPDYVAAHDLALETVRRTNGAVSYNTALRLVRMARRAGATDPARLIDSYGTGMLLDLCAIDVPIGWPAELAVAAIVCELASGLVLGSAAGTIEMGLGLQRLAVARARERLATERLDVARPPDRISVEWVVPDGLPRGTARARPVDVATESWDVADVGVRRFGGRTVSLIGKRIGALTLMPRATAAGQAPPAQAIAHRAAVQREEADDLVAHEVAIHDAPVRAAIRKAEARGLELVGSGALGAVLASIERAMSLA